MQLRPYNSSPNPGFNLNGSAREVAHAANSLMKILECYSEPPGKPVSCLIEGARGVCRSRTPGEVTPRDIRAIGEIHEGYASFWNRRGEGLVGLGAIFPTQTPGRYDLFIFGFPDDAERIARRLQSTLNRERSFDPAHDPAHVYPITDV